jgi:phosphate:Na+ symporter
MVCRLVGYDPTQGGQAALLPIVLATFHTCFNVTNTAILLGFIPQIERVVCWLMPEQEKVEQEEFKLRYIQANLVQTPEISVLQAQKETGHFAQRVQQMFGMVRQLTDEKDEEKFHKLFSQIAHQEDITDKMEIEIARFLEQVSDNHLSDITKTKVRQMMREISELESIGDACYNMARTLNRRLESGHDFTPELYNKVHVMMALADDALTQMNIVMSGHAKEYDIRDTYRIENDINQMRQRLKDENIQAVNDREYDYSIGTIFSDFINECEKLGDYVVNVVQARFGL